MKQLNKEHIEVIIRKMFEIAWYIFPWLDELSKEEMWFNNREWTQAQEDEWREWLMEYVKPFCFKSRLEKEVEWIITDYWLKIKKW